MRCYFFFFLTYVSISPSKLNDSISRPTPSLVENPLL